MVAGEAVAQNLHGKVPAFKPPVEFPAGKFPWGLDAADALGADQGEPLDGFPEIAVAVGQLNIFNGFAGAWTGQTGQVWVYRNSGDWSTVANGFDLNEIQVIDLDQIHPNTISADVAWADMTGEGRPDLVITGTTHFNGSYADGAWGIYVYRYDEADDKFVFHDYEMTTHPVRGLSVADFDNDGDVDVAAAGDLIDLNLGRGYIAISKNDGAGYLLPHALYGLGNQQATMQVVSGHFDATPGGETLPDLFTSRNGIGDGISLTNLDGTNYSPTIVSDCVGYFFTGIDIARFTSGGTSDDIVGISGDGFLYVLHGDGDGGFSINCGNEPNDRYFDGGGGGPFNFLPRDVATGNLNGATKPDVVVAFGAVAGSGDDAAEVRILLGQGNGQLHYVPHDDGYHPKLGPSADRPLRVILADLNQDGFDDIITSNHGDNLNDNGTISVLLNRLLISIP